MHSARAKWVWRIGRLLLILAVPPVFADAGDCVLDPQASLPADALPDEIDASLREALRRSLLNFEDCLPAPVLDAQSGSEAAKPSSSSNLAEAVERPGQDAAPPSAEGDAKPAWADGGSDVSVSAPEAAQSADAPATPRGSRSGRMTNAPATPRGRSGQTMEAPATPGGRSGQMANARTDPASVDGGGCPDGRCGSPYVEDDVARALRARAEREADPAIQQELWRVYRDYVKNAAQ